MIIKQSKSKPGQSHMPWKPLPPSRLLTSHWPLMRGCGKEHRYRERWRIGVSFGVFHISICKTSSIYLSGSWPLFWALDVYVKWPNGQCTWLSPGIANSIFKTELLILSKPAPLPAFILLLSTRCCHRPSAQAKSPSTQIWSMKSRHIYL